VILSPNGDRKTREYDGYGCGDVAEFDECKMVLADAYNNETFAELGESDYEPGQGVFHSRGLISVLRDLPSLPSSKAYSELLGSYENEEEAIRRDLLRERGIVCNDALGSKVAAALEDLAAGWETEFEKILERSPDVAALLPPSFEHTKKLARLFDDALLARTTAKAKQLVDQLAA
jgi:hypothetical protein